MTPGDSIPSPANPSLPLKRSRGRILHLHITRDGIYNTITLSKEGTRGSVAYNLFILLIIVVNLCACYLLTLDGVAGVDLFTDDIPDVITAYITGGILLLDYILRWVTADFKLKMGRKSFLLYPITPMAIIDMLAFFPTFLWVGNGLQALKILRFFVLLHKVKQKKFDINAYIHGITEIAAIFKKMKIPFISASIFVIVFVLLAALIMISVEPLTFDNNFLNALYWSAISWTGVGYGDLSPHSGVGRLITLLASLISVILIALPVSVVTAGITAGYLRSTFKEQGLQVTQEKSLNPNNTDKDGANTTSTEDEINFCPKCGTKCTQDDVYCKKCGRKLR